MSKNLYRESMRRIGRIGLAFLVITVVLTAILCAGNASNTAWVKMLDGPFKMLPALPFFALIGGIGFAYVGFAFLNRRCDSDFYHSLPVRRLDLYLSVTLAALTWTVATVVLSTLASMVVYLFMDVPFVPAYYLLSVPFFIVATMLAFAAAAIACSITGTLFSNVILTGIVLLLPRFILFILARGIVAEAWIVGWRDLQGILSPNANIVTGMLVTLTRRMLRIDIVSMGNIVYSLALACAELALGAWLFVRRPSELAERSARTGKLQTLFACLLTLPVMLLIVRSPRKLTLVILLAASLIVYLIYQFVTLRSPKRVLRSLPWYLCAVAAAAGLYFGTTGLGKAVLNDTPSADQIKSVRFYGNNYESAAQTYSALLVSQIDFTEDAVRQYTADSLKAAAERVKQPDYQGGRNFEDGGVEGTIESIVITLHSGRKIRRSIEFVNVNTLNDARNQNPQYAAALRAFPPREAISFLTTNYPNGEAMTAEDAEKLRASYVGECTAENTIADRYYDARIVREPSSLRPTVYQIYTANENQELGYFYTFGHLGTRRFGDHYSVSLKTPRTAGLYMMLSNNSVKPDVARNAAVTLEILRSKAPANGRIGVYCVFINVPMSDGSKQQVNLSHYGYVRDDKYQPDDYGASPELMEQILKIIQRGIPTADPGVLFVQLRCETNIRFDGNTDQKGDASASAYLAFTQEDEKMLLKMISEWNEGQLERHRIYQPDIEMPDVQVD